MVAIKKLTPVMGATASVEGHRSHYSDYSNGMIVDQNSIESGNLLRYAGPEGPYHYLKEIVDSDVPDGCHVNQVHLLSRHAERFPDRDEFCKFEELISKIQHHDPCGPLEFIKDYELFMNEEDSGKLTCNGPFSGRDSAYKLGEEFQGRYGHLINDCCDEGKKVGVFAASMGRVQETAHRFIEGFFNNHNNDGKYRNNNWEEHTDVVLLDEDSCMGGNSLTPYESCEPYKEQAHYAHSPEERGFLYGEEGHKILDRLNELVDSCLDIDDINSLFSLCAYELNAVGQSQFCEIFSHEEWAIHEYDQDVVDYYSRGPGNPYSRAVGSTYAKALLDLLHDDNTHGKGGYPHHHNRHDSDHYDHDWQDGDYSHHGHGHPFRHHNGNFALRNATTEGEHSQNAEIDPNIMLSQHHKNENTNLFFSFTHHEEVTAFLTSLGFWNPRYPLTKDQYPESGSPWIAADISPMKQHVTIERLECEENCCNDHDESCFVRLLLNDAVLPIPECKDGPGQSCSLSRFSHLLTSRLIDYADTCCIDEDVPAKPTFFWDRESHRVH